MNITIKTTVPATIERVWSAYTTPEDIKQWNAASDDWHTTA
ncbi:MAG: SRPBCC domain-containing protein, partial [Chloroflexi bacterium]|nr:SRPBCC domain-containing protein [Chloroflexota bacterium]